MKNEYMIGQGPDEGILIYVNTREGQRIVHIDAEDFGKVDIEDRYGLFKDKQGREFIRSGKASGQVFLHKQIVDMPRGSQLIHKNGNGFDYRKTNLQLQDRRGNITDLAEREEVIERAELFAKPAAPVLAVDYNQLEVRVAAEAEQSPKTAADVATSVMLDSIYDKREPEEPDRKTSSVKGVYFHKHAKKWHAAAFHGGKRYSLGYFDDVKDAEQEVKLFRAHGPESSLLRRNVSKGGT